MVNLQEAVNLAYSVVPPNTPKDTGNLLSAITTSLVGSNSIVTTLNGSTAIYGIFLDDGTPYIQQHKGFFSEKIFNAQVHIINRYLTGEVKPLGQQLEQGLVGEITPAQENANLESLASYDKYYGGNT